MAAGLPPDSHAAIEARTAGTFTDWKPASRRRTARARRLARRSAARWRRSRASSWAASRICERTVEWPARDGLSDAGLTAAAGATGIDRAMAPSAQTPRVLDFTGRKPPIRP